MHELGWKPETGILWYVISVALQWSADTETRKGCIITYLTSWPLITGLLNDIHQWRQGEKLEGVAVRLMTLTDALMSYSDMILSALLLLSEISGLFFAKMN